MKLTIYPDLDAANPMEDGDTFITRFWHKPNRTIHLLSKDSENPVDNKGNVYSHIAIALPLYLHVHGGRKLSLKPFSDPWDSGMLGYAYISRSELERVGLQDATPEQLRANLEAEVIAMNQWIEGEVFGYVLEGDEGEHIDSCFGLYDFDAAMAYLEPHLVDALPAKAIASLVQDALDRPGRTFEVDSYR